ncbi:MAG: NADP-specific glutamate dehydrogenase [Pseudomonadales bacterium]|nr:NADP-specific glutamate dehydrogenase [Pseudomonadales bacterium]
MNKATKSQINQFMEGLERRNPGEAMFHQAVYEVISSIIPYIQDKPEYHEYRILERLTEPDRIVSFRVCWEDDKGNVRVNRGYRVQHNNSIGPYKGGIRFHHDLNLAELKFLAFEQTFKNSLTGLPMGGGKGGSDFNPKGKSDREVMRFCQSFMTQLTRHIGPHTDIPAGDIGVGAREISYMFGQHLRLNNQFTGVLTGKGLAFGGSLVRTEATGYGSVYFMEDMLKQQGNSLDGKVATISGSGNVAQFTAEKAMQLGAKVVTLSDRSGFIYDKEGLSHDKLEFVKSLKTNKRGTLKEYADEFGCEFHADAKPWKVPCDIAFPSATQNDIDEDSAKLLVKNGCIGVSEGANMPSTIAAIDVFQQSNLLFGPSKAANAGGVAISGLEMTQNSMRLSWSVDELNERLRTIMRDIHDKCLEHGIEKNGVNYVKGANIAGFIKVANAMIAYGIV